MLTGVDPDLPSARRTVRPVATVYKVADEDEAVRVANDIPFGLGSYVFTTDAEQAAAGRRQDRRRHGIRQRGRRRRRRVAVRWRQTLRFGRELGRFGIDEFVNKKLIRIG